MLHNDRHPCASPAHCTHPKNLHYLETDIQSALRYTNKLMKPKSGNLYLLHFKLSVVNYLHPFPPLMHEDPPKAWF
jgi:hypothetical protein